MSLEGPPQIRNLVELNPSADAARFVARSLAGDARCLTLTQLNGGCELAAVCAPPRLGLTTLLPRATSFMATSSLTSTTTLEESSPPLAALLSDLRPVRMLLAGETANPDHVEKVAALYHPDVVWLPGDLRLDGLHASLQAAPYAPRVDTRAWGLGKTVLLANSAGAQALDTAFLAFDRTVRRRRNLRKIVHEVEDLVMDRGVAPVERDTFYSWAWTGPGTLASFLVPSNGASRLRLTVFFFGARTPVDADHIQLWVEGEKTTARHYQDELKIEADLPAPPAHCCLRVELRQARTVMTDDRSRQIGYALHKVAVELLS